MAGRARAGRSTALAELPVHDSPAGSELINAARTLLADSTTIEVVEALRTAGVSPILLKGPVLDKWLYRQRSRHYGDSDLLVSPADIGRAEGVLSGLGFTHPARDDIPGDRPWHAHCWVRSDRGGNVDLHRTLIGVGVSPPETWRILTHETEPMALAGSVVSILNERARALHVALHAAQDGIRLQKPLQDLELALETVERSVWRGAMELAGRLHATGALGAGLSLFPAGQALADALGLPRSWSTEVRLRATAAPPSALGYDWLMRIPTRRGQALFLLRKLFPSAEFVRAWSPLASKGWIGLAAAYMTRPVWLVWHGAKGLLPWWRAKRRSGTSR